MNSISDSKQRLISQLLAAGGAVCEVAHKVSTSKSYVYKVRKNSTFVPVLLKPEIPRSKGDGGFDPVWLGQLIGAVLREIK